jgi:hypothetical protein
MHPRPTRRLDPLAVAHHLVLVPAVEDAFQFVLSAVFEDESGPGGEVLDRRGDKHLRRV